MICFSCEGWIRDCPDNDNRTQRHIQRYPSCAVKSPWSTFYLLTWTMIIRLIKRVDLVITQTTETKRMLAARQLATEVTNMTASTTQGQILDRPARAQNMGLSRSDIAFRDGRERRKTLGGDFGMTRGLSSFVQGSGAGWFLLFWSRRYGPMHVVLWLAAGMGTRR